MVPFPMPEMTPKKFSFFTHVIDVDWDVHSPPETKTYFMAILVRVGEKIPDSTDLHTMGLATMNMDRQKKAGKWRRGKTYRRIWSQRRRDCQELEKEGS